MLKALSLIRVDIKHANTFYHGEIAEGRGLLSHQYFHKRVHYRVHRKIEKKKKKKKKNLILSTINRDRQTIMTQVQVFNAANISTIARITNKITSFKSFVTNQTLLPSKKWKREGVLAWKR